MERPLTRWKGVPTWLLAECGATVAEDGRVFIPYCTELNEQWNRRVFAGSRAWWETPGRPLIPFGLEALADAADRLNRGLLIAEGESDALMLRAAFSFMDADPYVAGYDVLGVPGASCWRDEWARWCDGYRLVYVLGDGDEPGRRFNYRISKDIPGARRVELPAGEDARSLLQRDGPIALDPYFDQADCDSVLYRAFAEAESLEEAKRIIAEGGLVPRAA